jgi:hypothetical protein
LKIVQREHPSFFNQPAKPSSDCSNVEPALKGDHFLAAMIGSYMTRVSFLTLLLLRRWHFLLIRLFEGSDVGLSPRKNSISARGNEEYQFSALFLTFHRSLPRSN